MKNHAHPHFEGGENASAERVEGFVPSELRSAYGYYGKFTGKEKRIAVICAFDSEGLQRSFDVFCEEFGLPTAEIGVFYPLGRAQSSTRRWRIESCIDVQWAHAFAPNAEIFAVFSPNADIENLLFCARYASLKLGADVTVMCFGREENEDDELLEQYFDGANGVFVCSSGDIGSVCHYPSSSPSCISVGGTKLLSFAPSSSRDELAWQNGGGGPSAVFDIPNWQGRFFNIFGMSAGKRSTPDISLNASFSPGACVYSAEDGGWLTVGGTSLASAIFGGICAAMLEAKQDIKSSADLAVFLYEMAGLVGYSPSQNCFFDITLGSSGKYSARLGYDFCTGLGSPKIRQLINS